MARPALAAIIDETRSLIGDDGASPRFTDDQVQAALDRYRRRMTNFELRPDTVTIGLVTTRVDWYGPTYVEAATFADGGYAALTPTESDALNGRWTFPASPDDVLLSGYEHDPYSAAADLLERLLIGGASTLIDMSTGRHSISRSGVAANYEASISRLRAASKEAGDHGEAYVLRIEDEGWL